MGVFPPDYKLQNLHSVSGIYKLFKEMHPDTSMSSDAKAFMLKLANQFPMEVVMTRKFNVGFARILEKAGDYTRKDKRQRVTLKDIKDANKKYPLKFTKSVSTKRKSSKRRSPKRKSSKRKSSKRKSSKRRSPKRKSSKRKSPNRKSSKRKSSKRRSPKRKSPNRKSSKRKSPKRNRHSPSLVRKRLDRPSPSSSAAETPINTIRKGNDGNYWIVKKSSSGVKRWVKYQK